MGRMGPISVLATHENLRKRLNTTKRLRFINRNVRFNKFIIQDINWASNDISV